MAKAKAGDKVQIHYRGTLEDGTGFDSSEGKDPLEFTLGEKAVIPGFENAVVGMEEGEIRTVSIPPEEAYGKHREDLVVSVERSQVPAHIDPQLGATLQVDTDDGHLNMVITKVTGEQVTLDANHPLAGKALTFEINLVNIE